jgi:hypothetical protein
MTFEAEETLFSRLVCAWEARHDLLESESRANKPIAVIVKSFDLGICFKTRIVAGSMGMTVKEDNGKEGGTVVQPCSGWWMLEYTREPLR